MPWLYKYAIWFQCSHINKVTDTALINEHSAMQLRDCILDFKVILYCLHNASHNDRNGSHEYKSTTHYDLVLHTEIDAQISYSMNV